MQRHDGWALGSWVKVDGRHTITHHRDLTPEEIERVPRAMDRIRELSGHAFLGPLVEALNELMPVLDEMLTATQGTLHQGAFRARLNGRLSGVLTAFSGLRASTENHAQRFARPGGSSTADNFGTLYREHPSFRLVWMLRNLDQHRPPAAAPLVVSIDEDPVDGSDRSRVVIDVADTVARSVKESTQRGHKRQWEECGALWEARAGRVDIREVLNEAFQACEIVLAAHLNECEALVLDDIAFVADMVAEVEPLGTAHVVRVERDNDGKLAHINDISLNPLTFGEALATMDASRRVLRKPSLQEDGLFPAPRFYGG